MKIFALFLIALASAQAFHVHVNVTDIQNLALGFLVGSKAAEEVIDGQDCVNLITNEIPLVKQTIQDIEALHRAQTFADMVKVFDDLKNITECTKTVQEGKKWAGEIANSFESRENITRGLINLLKNQDQLTQDYESFRTNMNTENMFLAGMNIGDMLKVFVYGSDSSELTTLNFSVEDTIHDIKDVVAGILVASKAIKDQDSANQCVDRLTLDTKAIVDAFNQLKKGDFKDIMAGIKEIFDAFMKSTDIVTQCKSIMTDGQNWVNSVEKRFTNKAEIAKGFLDLAENPFTVFGDIKKAVQDFQGHRNYYEAGTKIGEVLAIYCFGSSKFVTLLSSVPATWTDCGLADMKITVSDVQLDATPAKGIKDKITITGTMTDDEEFKYVEVLTTVNGGVLQKKNYDYSDIVSNGDDFNYEFEVQVPSFAPSGNYQVQMTHVNTSDEKVGCIRTTFTL